MNDRDRLIEIIEQHCLLRTDTKMCMADKTVGSCSECLADHLLANGVIVPPCKVGDTVYRVSFVHKNITPLMVEGYIRNLVSWKVHCTHLIPSWRGNQKEHTYISFSSFGKKSVPHPRRSRKSVEGDAKMRHASYQTNFIDYIIEPNVNHTGNIRTLKNHVVKAKLQRCIKMLQSAAENVQHAKARTRR